MQGERRGWLWQGRGEALQLCHRRCLCCLLSSRRLRLRQSLKQHMALASLHQQRGRKVADGELLHQRAHALAARHCKAASARARPQQLGAVSPLQGQSCPALRQLLACSLSSMQRGQRWHHEQQRVGGGQAGSSACCSCPAQGGQMLARGRCSSCCSSRGSHCLGSSLVGWGASS
jgi:hypothetical protein